MVLRPMDFPGPSEKVGTLFDMCTVGRHDSCFDQQQVDNHGLRRLVPEVGHSIALLTRTPFARALRCGKIVGSFRKINKWTCVVSPAGNGNALMVACE
jgi:hypothetical protein